jgi:hypothetical protein
MVNSYLTKRPGGPTAKKRAAFPLCFSFEKHEHKTARGKRRKNTGSISPLFPNEKHEHKTARGMRREKTGSISPCAVQQLTVEVSGMASGATHCTA